ncbi:hypothetical protein RvY_02956 [Ramazzottius varieornatus]|uniref:Uncharacterized protein n=1 Tax=Ramazzottius varieornatus TaxID=947166 RepID=A0A1D1ULG8_RAMVA|nr:hypothetical protein RvY_02956 [Ramazzottius varieornatus]
MESGNLLYILHLLLPDYEQHFPLSDSPSESHKMLKTLIKDFLDVQIDQAGSPMSATEEVLQDEFPIGVSTFDQLETSIGKTDLFHGHSEADFESTPNDRLTEPASSGTEPSSHELFVPRTPNPKVAPNQAADFAYTKRAVGYWTNVSSKKRRSQSPVLAS